MGRRAERDAVETLVSRARSGQSGVLVVRGEAGIGKTALLELCRQSAERQRFRVESSTGAEDEAQFAFAGLHQLCAPLMAFAARLPGPQQVALGVAFGRQEGAVPDRFLVGLATLNLVAEAAEESPLLCLIDDAHWLDEASAQVLAFVARRLGAERIALVLAARDPADGGSPAFAGLPELCVGGLSDEEARALLDGAVRTPIDDRVRERILAEARGNPLALIELPLSWPSAQRAGGFQLPESRGVPTRIEESFRRRSRGLPIETRLLLLVAAAEPTGDAALLWRATAELDVDRESADPAEAAGLLEIGARVTFRHPLVRSAIYRTATLPDRRRAHAALAAATDPQTDPDRRAWHRAHAVVGTDEAVAAELEDSAGRARGRGGLAAAAAFLQRATELTPEPADRARRALDAVLTKHEAGASEEALELLSAVASGPLDRLQAARLSLLRAQITFHLRRDAHASAMLLEAAATLLPLDAELSHDAHLLALDAAILTGDASGASRIGMVARAALATGAIVRPVDHVLDGLAAAHADGYAAGAPRLRIALRTLLDAARDDAPGSDSALRLWMGGRTAVGILDDELAHGLAARAVELARADGALADLPWALNLHANVLTLSGQLARASELIAESAAIAESTGVVPLQHPNAVLAAWRGDRARAIELDDVSRHDARNAPEGTIVALGEYALAVLHNGLGEYADAAAHAARASDGVELTLASIALPELVEAAFRAGDADRAAIALEQLSTRARVSGTSWALGLEARSRALAITGADAEQHYREAIAHLESSLVAGEAARAHLLYGEWLRRAGRRQDARDELRIAHELLSTMGADGFAARAARELRATGEHPRRRTAQPADALTAHELHIARLVASGATSREVGAQLFLSPRTIEAHLRNIFRKLGITSRRDLRRLTLP